MRPSPTRHRIALALALAGVALSVLALEVHRRLAEGSGYASFCNLGGVVNCDAVLGSRYSVLLGVPVAAWGLLAFIAGALLALPGALGVGAGGLADLLLLGLASASLGFALVMGVAMASLGNLCLLCLATDVVIVTWFLTVLPLASRFEPGGKAGWWRRRAGAWGITTAALLVAVAGGTWAAGGPPSTGRTPDEGQAPEPKVYPWDTQLPRPPLRE